jgi:NarL family two-component system response regulator LiaR
MASRVFHKNKQLILYGIALAFLLFLLKWLEWHFLIFKNSIEIYAGSLALIFTALGIWLATKLIKPKTVVVEKTVLQNDFTLNEIELDRLRISNRELEVLQLMARGLSNQEIAEKLFVSLNTIKTHSSNLFLKLEVERRTQAIEKAKRLSLIP